MITAVKNRIIQKSMLITRMSGQRSITYSDGFQNIYGSLLQSQRLTKFKQQQGCDKKTSIVVHFWSELDLDYYW